MRTTSIVSAINFLVILLCFFIGGSFIFISRSTELQYFFIMNVTQCSQIFGGIFLFFSIALILCLRLQEGKKTLRIKMDSTAFEIDRKILQERISRYFQKIDHFSPKVNISSDHNLEIQLKVKISPKEEILKLWEEDLAKILKEMGYKGSFYVNFSQSV